MPIKKNYTSNKVMALYGLCFAVIIALIAAAIFWSQKSRTPAEPRPTASPVEPGVAASKFKVLPPAGDGQQNAGRNLPPAAPLSDGGAIVSRFKIEPAFEPKKDTGMNPSPGSGPMAGTLPSAQLPAVPPEPGKRIDDGKITKTPAPAGQVRQRQKESGIGKKIDLTAPPDQTPSSQLPAAAAEPGKIIDYGQVGKDPALAALMQQRKKDFGVEKGIDLIVKSDETLKIGENLVPMRRIIDQMRIKQGEILEKDITARPQPGTGAPETAARRSLPEMAAGQNPGSPGQHNLSLNAGDAGRFPARRNDLYGIYIVQPEDNIWDIHFNFLKHYFSSKGVTLKNSADEPDRMGYSSGVGRILKYSENMVYIYNIREQKLDVDINLITPLNKIIIFNMEPVFALLDQIDLNNITQIIFDGYTLWVSDTGTMPKN
ncbi:MAG: hypothetical protein Q8P24_00830 [Desulfobacterales bacterium]|nr:hypothetical protein [Desulfobacterales bacterium]